MIAAMHNLKLKNFVDIREALAQMPRACESARACVREREMCLTKPEGALGRLEQITRWLAAWQRRSRPQTECLRAVIFAGTHGVTQRGVSAYPSSVTSQMVANFEAGGAAINQLCGSLGVELTVEPLALERPTADITQAPAMDEAECMEAVRRGMEMTESGADVLCVGEMGIGNTTSAAALTCALFGGKAGHWTGYGTGVQEDALERKRAVVAEAVQYHTEKTADPLDLMCRLGGRELAAILGAVLGARFNRTPIVFDGYVATAAAAPLFCLAKGALDHCMSGHVSVEPGHRLLLQRLGMRPLLDLDMRLGEASGAVLAVSILKAATACHNGMATFEKAGVATKIVKPKGSI